MFVCLQFAYELTCFQQKTKEAEVIYAFMPTTMITAKGEVNAVCRHLCPFPVNLNLLLKLRGIVPVKMREASPVR